MVIRARVFALLVVLLLLAACAAASSAPGGLIVPSGFSVEAIANIDGARELAVLPDGALVVGTRGSDIYLVPDAEGNPPGRPRVFARLDDARASGVAVDPAHAEIFVGTTQHVWAIPYDAEAKGGEIRHIADVRSGPEAPGTDGDVHWTTSVALTQGHLYVSAGSSCNATMEGARPCAEVDPTRAAISVMQPDGSGFAQRAKRIRNAIALAVNPQTGSLWVGDAGQDALPFGHPYEFLDDLSAHPGDADYGWPVCEENRQAYVPGYNCSNVVEPLVELPAYSTIIGAVFYPVRQGGAYAFPARYRGGLFAAAHGSWHIDSHGCYAAPPRVVFVPMQGDQPVKPVDWQNPQTQWTEFVSGFQSCRTRIGRPTGIAVGAQGSLFVADDDAGKIYRIRPSR